MSNEKLLSVQVLGEPKRRIMRQAAAWRLIRNLQGVSYGIRPVNREEVEQARIDQLLGLHEPVQVGP